MWRIYSTPDPHRSPISRLLRHTRGCGPILTRILTGVAGRGLCIACNTLRMLVMYWLIEYLLFYIPLKNISLIWRRHHYQWRAAKFRPMLGAQGLWAGRGLYCATPAVTRGLGFSGLIRRTAPFSCLLRHTRGCGPILPWILSWVAGRGLCIACNTLRMLVLIMLTKYVIGCMIHVYCKTRKLSYELQ